MHETTGVVEITRIVGDDPGHFAALGQFDQRTCQRCLGGAGMMELSLDREPRAKHLAPSAERAAGSNLIASEKE